MHLFEAALAWEQVAEVATDDRRAPWRALADEIAELALARFIDPANGALSEYFDLDWQPPEVTARRVEPGHQFEWSWLLHRWARVRQRPDVLQAARRLGAIGEAHGVDRRRQVAIDELDGTLCPTDPNARLWPQTERLKAACAAWQDRPEDQAQRGITDAARGLMQYFLAAPVGLWNERQRADGRFEADDVRASSLYHIVCAIDTLHTLVRAPGEGVDNP